MSPNPPVLASGTASEATSNTFKDKADSWRLKDEKRWAVLGLINRRRTRPVLLSEGRGDADSLEQTLCHAAKIFLKPRESVRHAALNR
jgi:hypothetical protein